MIKRFLICTVLISCFLMGCTKEEPKKAEILPGYWQALRMSNTYVNGVFSRESEKGFYVEFFDNNCGQLFDRDENPTNEIKWAFQERDTIDLLLISTALNSSIGSSDLYMNELNVVEKIEESNMRTFRTYDRIIDGDEYCYSHRTFFVKQK